MAAKRRKCCVCEKRRMIRVYRLSGDYGDIPLIVRLCAKCAKRGGKEASK